MNIRQAQDKFEAWAKENIFLGISPRTPTQQLPITTSIDLMQQTWVKKRGNVVRFKTWIKENKIYLLKSTQISEAMFEAWLEAMEKS